MSVTEALIAQPSPHLLSIATHKKCTLAESPREGGRRWCRKVATDACTNAISSLPIVKPLALLVSARAKAKEIEFQLSRRTGTALY